MEETKHGEDELSYWNDDLDDLSFLDNFDVGIFDQLDSSHVDAAKKEYYPEIDNPETDFVQKIHSIGPTYQGNLDSCAVWALSNAITRAFSIYYNLINSDKRNIIWKENSDTNCIQYTKTNTNYKYCIIFNFFQLFIRKKVGTCGITPENMLGAIKTINDDLFLNERNMYSNIRLLGSESDIHISTYNKNRSQISKDYKNFLKTDEFRQFLKNDKKSNLSKNKRSNKVNTIRQQNVGITKTPSQIKARDLHDKFIKLHQRKSEITTTVKESHIQDLSDIFLQFIDDNVVLKTMHVNENLKLAIQLVNKEGYYGVIGITFQNSWYILFIQLSTNTDFNNDIFVQLRNLLIIPEGEADYGHAMVVKRIRYNRDTEEYEYLIKNSWGPTWGNNGELWIPEGCLPLFYSIDVIYLEKLDVNALKGKGIQTKKSKKKSNKIKKSKKSIKKRTK